jgi:long-chain alkane monooxygenase
MTGRKQMHFFLFNFPPFVDHFPSAWRHPQSMAGGSYNYLDPDVWMHEARVLEDMLLDAWFVGDSCGIYSAHHNSIETSVKFGSQSIQHFAALFAQMQAFAAPTLGVVSTILTTELHPFTTARILQTMDHLTKGRVGWNVVTGINPSTMQHLGKELIEHDRRYDIAEEYMELCYKLWQSWDDGALLLHKESGQFADPNKVHEVNFDGKWFKCRGPLTLPRSPQIMPVIVQAGQSPRGRDFGAKHAEAIFTIYPDMGRMKKFYSDIKQRMQKFGRDPEDCAILPGVMPIVGTTQAEAEDKYAVMQEVGTYEAGFAWLAGTTGLDFSQYDPDTLMSQIDETKIPGFQGIREIATPAPGSLRATPYLRKEPQVEPTELTLKHVGQGHAEGIVPKIVGTPAQVADQLEQLIDEAAADGFMLSAVHHPGSMEEFRPVIAELQRRGRFRKEYEGPTLRERLGTKPLPWATGVKGHT